MILVNGKQSNTLPTTDRGLHYGDGVWETILIKHGRLILLSEHLDRLQLGLHRLAISVNFNQLCDEIERIRQLADNHILKVIITRGSGGRGYNPAGVDSETRILSLHPVPEFSKNYHDEGIKLTLCNTRLAHNPQFAGFKHLNRLEQVMARAEFAEPYQEGLVMDYLNHVIEGTMSNLFLIKGEIISTPALDNCGIRGVMQAHVVKQLTDDGYTVENNANITVQNVQEADAAFMTNSVIGVWFVQSFTAESSTIRYAPHKIISKLQEQIKEVS